MPLTILRWKGGSGGDMLLHMIGKTLPVINVRYIGISDSGQTVVDRSWLDFTCLTELQKMCSIPVVVDSVDVNKLTKEVEVYEQQSGMHWAKSHYYASDKFNSITIDLVVDPVAMPFVIKANVEKTSSAFESYNSLVEKIPTLDLRKKYTMYSQAVDIVRFTTNLSSKTIAVQSLISGADELQSVLQPYCSNGFNGKIYNSWLNNNQSYLPSKNYQDKIANKDYNFHDKDLSLAEKYSLLALSGKKFINFEE